MGIPRLTQDVTPYAQTCIFGQHSADASIISVTRLVIDGPSLVYHIYNALLRHFSVVGADQYLMSFGYAHINECFAQFLRDVTNSGVQIKALIFDGGLPVSKRPTRLERLERTRQNLDNYRKLQNYHSSSSQAGSSTNDFGARTPRPVDYQAVLWDDANAVSGKQSLLPPPPFMVASVIESLQRSEWSSITRIVPGEADGFCASDAASSSSAILSNDSDLLMYDLGTNGTVVVLRTLEAVDFPLENQPGALRAQCYQLAHLAKLLNVPDMRSFGFQRSIDSSSSTSFIAQRARDFSSLEDNAHWLAFKHEYQNAGWQFSFDGELHESGRDLLQKLDPRLSEVFTRLKSSESPHSYLPIVLEDPTRDSAWSYGSSIRQLAYSLLLNFGAVSTTSQADHVDEFARKGARIAAQHVKVMSQTQFMEEAERLVTVYDHYFSSPSPSHSTARPSDSHNQSSFRRDSSTRTSETVFLYHLIATETVIAQRLASSKFYMPEVSNLFPHNNASFPLSSSISWEDIHFHACIQCTLYSHRMLKQVVDILNGRMVASGSIQNTLKVLSTRLAGMPDLADLFIDSTTLRTTVLQLDPGYVARNVRSLLQRVDPAYLSSLYNRNKISPSPARSSLDSETHSKTQTRWTTASSKSKAKKRTSVPSTLQSSRRNDKPRLNLQQVGHTQSNAFALLQGAEDSSDID